MPGSRRRAVKRFAVVLVTAPDLTVARKLAKACLEARAAACVNIVPRLESHYWWQGKLERGNELLLLIKTTAARLGALEKCVLANHPYDTPEFVVLPIASGNQRYLEWISSSLK
jgi:periplasmic divalent cation tolerance protein